MAKYLKKNMSSIIEDKIKSSLSKIKKIPDNCTICDKKFNKQDKEQVFSWMLKVDEEREVYNLFCPPCYERYHPSESEEGASNE